MDIISFQFIFSALAAAIIYYFLKGKSRVIFLAVLSAAFIISLDYILILYVTAYTIFNFFIGKRIANTGKKKFYYRLGIIVNLAQLILLRYASFSIDPLFEFLHSSVRISSISEIIIPLGISYYTLQAIGYLINIKMGWEKPVERFESFFVYITFFPKFISGPIERSNHFLPQLQESKSVDKELMSSGLRTILFGFFKKVAIANQLAPYIFDAFSNVHTLESQYLLIILLLLPIYLYFDFSGYTDIAIGTARLFGIELLPNFTRPFFAENVSNFWRRFHISLASWFNDYIFRQTVLKRRRWGVYASVYGVFLTWLLFGIWHGGGWHFMILGLLQAIAINYEYFTRGFRRKLFSKIPTPIDKWIGRTITYLFYCISLVFFFSSDLGSALSFFSGLFGDFNRLVIDDLSTKPFMLFVYVPLFLLVELVENDYDKLYNKVIGVWYSDAWKYKILRWSFYSILITIIFILGLKSEQFVYANF